MVMGKSDMYVKRRPLIEKLKRSNGLKFISRDERPELLTCKSLFGL